MRKVRGAIIEDAIIEVNRLKLLDVVSGGGQYFFSSSHFCLSVKEKANNKKVDDFAVSGQRHSA